MDKECLLYYRLGEYVAEIMLNGIYHPDMQISNIGFRPGEAAPLFLDYPEVEKFKMPEELDADRIRQLTEAIFPLIEAMDGSFLFNSYFRAGYLGYGGVLTWELFTNAINNGFSSNIYVKHAEVNPLGDWTGGTDVDTGATNRKLGSDMADSVTGGGLHGKDLSKADVSVNIYAFLKAQSLGVPVTLCCAIGDTETDGVPYSNIVEEARGFIHSIGSFEKFAEWGLF